MDASDLLSAETCPQGEVMGSISGLAQIIKQLKIYCVKIVKLIRMACETFTTLTHAALEKHEIL